MFKNFVRRPSWIYAVQYKGTDNFQTIKDEIGNRFYYDSAESNAYVALDYDKNVIEVVHEGDWIVKEDNNLYSVMSDKELNKKYVREFRD